ncbi:MULTISPECIES: iron-containing alcohol dehydrogenase [Streptomyces]|jgi:alcohol dehydrogenase class IV|uniref:Iron-containing alcohol dehydrogenase n=1 Tax=Streptomyces thermogriseus TaxID=75292 RepID=A0ABN1SUD2_9ACTN|nr:MULTISPECIES: iron-containing alcohol dehydrogenase [Streptomyces]MDN5380561.1 iron-containing alcohol dehydrogenase [Streptomyces sp. LB8]
MSLVSGVMMTSGNESSVDWGRDAYQCELLGPQKTGTDAVRRSARLAKFHVPEVVFGPGSLAEIGHCALRLGGRRPFLVTDPGLIEAGWVDEAVGHLRRVGLRPVLWYDVTPNPKDHEVEAGFQQYAASGCDVIVGLGGGSVIDAAKGVAILSSNGGRILDYGGVDRVGLPIPPTVMVPSTSGTGADVSQFAVITDTTEHVKVTIVSRTLVPEISVIDPRLLTTMPDWLNAATGLDALTHAIEAFVSRAHSPLTDSHALHAVELITGNLVRTQVRPKDFTARLAMAQASLEAGMAFTNAILGATHAMSHQVGGLLDAPHGVVNGVLLPHVIRFNAEAWPERFVALGAAAGIPTDGVPPQEVAAQLAELVRGLADDVGVPKGLASLGVAESDVPVLARTTLKDACMATNPRDVDVRDVETLFRAAL